MNREAEEYSTASHAARADRPFGDIPHEELLLEREHYDIRLVSTSRQRIKTGIFIERMYSCRGYHTDICALLQNRANQLTLEASDPCRILGTLTLGMDSESGLLADELYGREINFFRRQNRKVCELSRLAMDLEHGSKEMLASLFHLAYILGRNINKATDLFIEVNPRHAGFYRRMLGLRQIGEERTCRRVQAPAVLMHLELDYVDEKIAQLAGLAELCDQGERSLYPYFFSKREEEKAASKVSGYLSRIMSGTPAVLSD
ncbi:hypothetical protein [Nitrosovibrio sp. Nv17]|uniref:N-acyl amino acid synthase FeeM domain-containing protein n=1 Tax=Nitrosovibrio sp. Nv17 TaxID=1855339 RepID=UPI0009088BF4|nr:hypothetical protein [Nitrosovibrio sp. Nv17]SFW11279.1 hypothetical protein SAMN05216414_101235 [Nitrosovibrio sp. Nv17]